MTTTPTTPPVTVRSPALLLRRYDRVSIFATATHSWFCRHPIAAMVEIPDAGPCRIAAQTEQWPDDTGIPVEVRFNAFGEPRYRFKGRRSWEPLYARVGPKLRKLGVPDDGTPVMIYWRLETEVEDD